MKDFSIFAQMVKRGKITAAFSSLVLLLFLAASSGIAISTHVCHHCGDKTTLAGFRSEAETHSHACCNNGSGCHSEETSHATTDDEGCCDVKLSFFKVTNYIPEFSGKITVWIPSVTVAISTELPLRNESPVSKIQRIDPGYSGPPGYTLHRQLLI